MPLCEPQRLRHLVAITTGNADQLPQINSGAMTRQLISSADLSMI